MKGASPVKDLWGTPDPVSGSEYASVKHTKNSSNLPPPPLLAVRCPAVGPTLLAVAPRVPPRPRFLLFLYIY